MKRERVEATLERQFLTALVTSKDFLAVAESIWDDELIETKYVQRVARWCLGFWGTYRKAPEASITNIYHAWVANDKPGDEEAETVSAFLESLSSLHDATPPNVPHLTATLGTYFTTRKLELLQNTLQAHLSRGQHAEALEAVTTFRVVQNLAEVGYDPFSEAARVRAYTEPPDGIIDWPPTARRFMGRTFRRSALVGILGTEKRGKTTWCMELVYRAIRSNIRVALFEVGDESEEELTQRMDARVAMLPVRDQGEIKYPTKIRVVEEEGRRMAEVAYRTFNPGGNLTMGISRRAAARLHRLYRMDPRHPRVKFSVHASKTINVRGINSVLERWQHEENWVADIIIVDYADNLAPEDGKQDFRHQQNETWQALRRLSQERHACVVAPTQADADSYGAWALGIKNFSEDKRKNAHVTAFMGINQTAEEKAQQVQRLNFFLKRGEYYDQREMLWVAGCPALGAAMVRCAT